MEKHQHKAILVIEDDESIRDSFRFILEQEGYQVFTASNGQEGLQCLVTMPHPCLILLDLFMPIMNGIEFLHSLKKEDADIVASIPIVIVSASPPEADVAQEAKQFTKGFIKKPVDLDRFLELVEQYCSQC